jgi:hypothetical protein
VTAAGAMVPGDMNRELERYRERFRTAPVGVWSQASGTFATIMNEVWTIRPDHTGTIELRAGSGESWIRFEWAEVGDFHIRVRMLDWRDTEEADDPPVDEDEPWVDVRYEFDVKPLGDIPARVVQMHEVGREGFWTSDSPLMLDRELAPLSP